MESYDLEVGPIQLAFEKLFMRIEQYFNTAPVAPNGSITETDLSIYSQDHLKKTLGSILEHYGFTVLPLSMKITVSEDSKVSGIYRSDNITIYEERFDDLSYRTFNFYGSSGPKGMKASYYWRDVYKTGEQIHAILTDDDRWYVKHTTKNFVYFSRMEQSISSK